MLNKCTALSVVAAALLLAPAAQSPARALSGLEAGIASSGGVTEVRHRGHGGFRFHGGGGFKHRGFHPRGFTFRHGPRFHHGHKFRHGRHFRHGPKLRYVLPYYYPYVYSYGYGYDSCYWLKVKAIRTGSRYWWWRYEECLNYW